MEGLTVQASYCSGFVLSFAVDGAGSVVVDVLLFDVLRVGAALLVSGLLAGSFAMGLDPVGGIGLD